MNTASILSDSTSLPDTFKIKLVGTKFFVKGTLGRKMKPVLIKFSPTGTDLTSFSRPITRQNSSKLQPLLTLPVMRSPTSTHNMFMTHYLRLPRDIRISYSKRQMCHSPRLLEVLVTELMQTESSWHLLQVFPLLSSLPQSFPESSTRRRLVFSSCKE